LIPTISHDSTPFIVGLASHWDLEPTQMPRLIETVAGLLRELRERLPNTEMRLMLDAHCDVAVEVGRGLDPFGMPADELSAHVADVMVHRSSLLVVLWDGEASTQADDTADMLLRFLEVVGERRDAGLAPEIASMEHDPDVTERLAYWVPARRRRSPATAGSPQPGFLLAVGDHIMESQTTLPSSLQHRLADFDEFNRDFALFCKDPRLLRSESLLRNLQEEKEANDAPLLRYIDAQYVKADSLAVHMQWRSDRLFSLFGIMTFTMGLAYLIYDKVTESRLLLLVYMLILFVSLCAYYAFQSRRWFGKHLAYRALAETLRVRFYLALAGLDRRMHTGDLLELSGIYRFRGFSWLRFVLDSIEPVAAETNCTDDQFRQRARFVDQEWIDNQYQYFVRKVATMEKGSRRVKRLKRLMFIAILIDISAMFVFGETLHHVDTLTGLPVKNVLTFCSGFLAVVLGVWELRHNKMATRELLWQYRSQLSQFAWARKQLHRITNQVRRADVLSELGEASLMEIYLWAIHRYHREHSPPAGP
jgi:hypothetical protein